MNVSIKDDIPPSTNNDEVITINSTNLDNSTVKNKPKDADKKPKSIKIEWSPENELIMVEWCDVAQCYKWMNARAHSRYSRLHAWYTIPAIIFSTLSGTASFAQSSIPDSYKQYAPAVIGSINIFIGILSTIQQYLKISELNEAHRISSISWDKFSRNIRIELAKRPEERCDAGSFLKVCRGEFDRLMETSPDISEDIISEFYNKFSGKKGTEKRRRFDQLRKPDICDTLVSANETRHKWYLELETAMDHHDITDDTDEEDIRVKNKLIVEQQSLLKAAEEELRKRTENEQLSLKQQLEDLKLNQEKQAKDAAVVHNQITYIQKYITSFENIYDRKPLVDEIRDNVVGNVDITILNHFLANYTPV
jgi:hypothetical protein